MSTTGIRKVFWIDDMQDPTDRLHQDLISAIAPKATKVIWIKSYWEFRREMEVTHPNHIYAIFFGHHLGHGARTGMEILLWFQERIKKHNIRPCILHTQVINMSHKRQFQIAFQKLYQHWMYTTKEKVDEQSSP